MDVEKILPLEDPSCGLRGFIVIHGTARGPATGGIRLYPYASDEAARTDGYRLARAMTFKAAAADLPVGGGKIVVIDAPGLEREKALRSVGRTLESMNGAFLAGRDMGIPVADGAIIRSQTRYMVDESEEGVGDLNLATALGVLAGARAALAFGSPSGSRCAIRAARRSKHSERRRLFVKCPPTLSTTLTASSSHHAPLAAASTPTRRSD